MKKLLTFVALFTITFTVSAEYLRDSSGDVAHNPFGICWTDSQGTFNEPDGELLKCGDAVEVVTEVDNEIFIPSAVNFDFDSADLDEEALATIKHIGSQLPPAAVDIAIVGHTDAVGTEQYNEMLGYIRARNVATALGEYTLGNPLIFSAGENRLLVDTQGPERANRRADIGAAWIDVVTTIERTDR